MKCAAVLRSGASSRRCRLPRGHSFSHDYRERHELRDELVIILRMRRGDWLLTREIAALVGVRPTEAMRELKILAFAPQLVVRSASWLRWRLA